MRIYYLSRSLYRYTSFSKHCFKIVFIRSITLTTFKAKSGTMKNTKMALDDFGAFTYCLITFSDSLSPIGSSSQFCLLFKVFTGLPTQPALFLLSSHIFPMGNVGQYFMLIATSKHLSFLFYHLCKCHQFFKDSFTVHYLAEFNDQKCQRLC